jgi:hypothetical protein
VKFDLFSIILLKNEDPHPASFVPAYITNNKQLIYSGAYHLHIHPISVHTPTGGVAELFSHIITFNYCIPKPISIATSIMIIIPALSFLILYIKNNSNQILLWKLLLPHTLRACSVPLESFRPEWFPKYRYIKKFVIDRTRGQDLFRVKN